MRSARLRRGSGVSRTCFSVSTYCNEVVINGWVTHVLHDADSLLGLTDKLVLRLLNLRPCLLAQIILTAIFAASLTGQVEDRTLGTRLGRIKAQS